MLGQPRGRGQKLFKRRPLADFPLLRLPAVTAGIQILIKESPDVELVKRIRLRFLRNLLRFIADEIFVAVIVRRGGFFALFFQDRVLNHLLIDHFPKFQPVQRQHADHLHQARRQNLLLRHLQIEF